MAWCGGERFGSGVLAGCDQEGLIALAIVAAIVLVLAVQMGRAGGANQERRRSEAQQERGAYSTPAARAVLWSMAAVAGIVAVLAALSFGGAWLVGLIVAAGCTLGWLAYVLVQYRQAKQGARVGSEPLVRFKQR